MDIRHAVGVKVGLAEAKLAALDDYRSSPHFDGRERAALEFSERIVRHDLDVTDDCFAQLREHFDDSEIVELAAIVGYQSFASKFAKAFSLTPQGFSP